MSAVAHWVDKEKDSRKPIRGPRGMRSLTYSERTSDDEKKLIARENARNDILPVPKRISI